MLGFILTFFISVAFAPIIIFLLKKFKLGQNILGYVTEHKDKQGTPTMGGLIFIIPTIIVSIFLNLKNLHFILFILSVFLGFGLIGFLDDYIKIKFNRNLGLRPYQKIIFQILLSIIVSFYIYKSDIFSNEIIIPFTTYRLNLGVFIIPFLILTILATTNSVNLTDGIDGLAGSVSFFCLIFFYFLSQVYLLKFGGDNYLIENVNSLQSISLCLSGGLLAYLLFNVNPASVFMGDTGSLSLGGIIAVLFCCCGLELFIVMVGIMFVLSSMSVILQVLFFKITKKRIFLMAPFHHHLQKKGLSETKIDVLYSAVTIIMGLLCILSVY